MSESANVLEHGLKVSDRTMRYWGAIMSCFLVVYVAVILWGLVLKDYASEQYQKIVTAGLTDMLIVFAVLSAREMVPLVVAAIREFHYHQFTYPKHYGEQLEREYAERRQVMIAKAIEKQTRRRKHKPVGSPVDLSQWFRQRSRTGGGYVYILKDVEVSDTYKIGKTRRPYERMRSFAVNLPFAVELIHVIACDNADQTEHQLHRRFAEKRRRGEWFALEASDVEWIKTIHESRSNPSGEVLS